DAHEALIRSLANPDQVKVPAIRALGRLGRPEANGALIGLLNDQKSSSPVRVAAARALGEIAAATGSPNADAIQALATALGDADAAVRDGAAAGLAVAPLNPAQRAAVYT